MKKNVEKLVFWQHKPGNNYHLGYKEGKICPSAGVKEKCLNIVIKDGRGLNK